MGAIVSPPDGRGSDALPAPPEAGELGTMILGSVGCNATFALRGSLPAPESGGVGRCDLADDEDEISVSIMATAGVER